jgi:hypothetical protein
MRERRRKKYKTILAAWGRLPGRARDIWHHQNSQELEKNTALRKYHVKENI